MDSNDLSTIKNVQYKQIPSIQLHNANKQFDDKLRILNEISIKNGKRSCDNCRLRKVRCDANTIFPCTKCQKTGLVCEFRIKRRKPGPAPRKDKKQTENQIQRTESLLAYREEATKTSTDDHYHNIAPVSSSVLSRQQQKQKQQILSISSQQKYITFVHNYNIRLFSSMHLINKVPNLTSELAEHIMEG